MAVAPIGQTFYGTRQTPSTRTLFRTLPGTISFIPTYVRTYDAVRELTSWDTLQTDQVIQHHFTSQPQRPLVSWQADGPDRTKWQLNF